MVIANRVKGKGDTWTLVKVPHDFKEYPSLTEVLEQFYQNTKYDGDFILSPLKGKIYIKGETQPEPPKKFNIYGDY